MDKPRTTRPPRLSLPIPFLVLLAVLVFTLGNHGPLMYFYIDSIHD